VPRAKTKTAAPAEKKRGRPTLYRPEFCERIVALGSEGKSHEQIAAALGVSLRTLDVWRDAHFEFAEAMEHAKTVEMAWWENAAQAYMIESPGGEKLNSAVWAKSMQARFHAKYRDNQSVELTGKDGAPVLAGIQVSFIKPPDAT